jgi:hypothetical protein
MQGTLPLRQPARPAGIEIPGVEGSQDVMLIETMFIFSAMMTLAPEPSVRF